MLPVAPSAALLLASPSRGGKRVRSAAPAVSEATLAPTTDQVFLTYLLSSSVLHVLARTASTHRVKIAACQAVGHVGIRECKAAGNCKQPTYLLVTEALIVRNTHPHASTATLEACMWSAAEVQQQLSSTDGIDEVKHVLPLVYKA
eukprot:1825489-Pleurochrysis_carterae.AAC.17